METPFLSAWAGQEPKAGEHTSPQGCGGRCRPAPRAARGHTQRRDTCGWESVLSAKVTDARSLARSQLYQSDQCQHTCDVTHAQCHSSRRFERAEGWTGPGGRGRSPGTGTEGSSEHAAVQNRVCRGDQNTCQRLLPFTDTQTEHTPGANVS